MQKSTVVLRKVQGPTDGHTNSKQAKKISTEGKSPKNVAQGCSDLVHFVDKEKSEE